MFTEDQIKTALGKVKTGADFPALVQDLKHIGVIYYQTFVEDAHSIYHGKDNFKLTTSPRFEPIAIADVTNLDQFKIDIKNHQQGKSNFPEIVMQCAANGVASWIVRIDEMTCTYFDKSGEELLDEKIPVV